MPVAIPTATTATAATATSATVPAAAAPAWGTLFARTRFINCQGAALEVFLVEHVDCLGRIVLRPHLDKRKTTRTARGAILHDIDRDHRASLREVILQVVFGDVEG